MNEGSRILVVEDDEEMRALLEEELAACGYSVVLAGDGEEALERLDGVDVVVTDRRMPKLGGDELLRAVQTRDPDLPVVLITAFGSIESAVESVKAGAFHYVAKPFRMELLLDTVARALSERLARAELRDHRAPADAAHPSIVAASRPMRDVVELARRVAKTDSPVLLLGESGTGKELVARAIHQWSDRSTKRFTAVNCSAIPDNLLESQLFGYRRGAFTDAREDRPGLFVETQGGTLLLDEIGDMPVQLQMKLLRVLQEKEVLPLGASVAVPVNVRVVAATHRDLERRIAEGLFREDLYYRLNVIAMRIPPLRERPEDIVPLVARFLDKHGERMGRRDCRPSAEVLALLKRHRWTGNVRELENVIERALVLGHGAVIEAGDLPERLRAEAAAPADGSGPIPPLVDVEREHIRRALEATGGNKARAARILGMDRKTLYRKLEQYRLPDS